METIDVTIETPKGCSAKYDFDPRTNQYRLNKIMPAGTVFPFDFGFIPGTLGGDGDPLDALVINDSPTFTGCIIEARVIGCLISEQKEKSQSVVRNDRFITVPVNATVYDNIKTVSDLSQQLVDEIKAFFINYNEQAGKDFIPVKMKNAKEAQKMIDRAKKQLTPCTKLIELFLPLKDKEFKPFSMHYFKTVKKQLLEKFGGVTIFSRSPVTGFWDESGTSQEKDEIIIFEVMADDIDIAFWSAYKKALEKKFRQEKLLVRKSDIGLL